MSKGISRFESNIDLLVELSETGDLNFIKAKATFFNKQVY
jgi:hypothetical protein